MLRENMTQLFNVYIYPCIIKSASLDLRRTSHSGIWHELVRTMCTYTHLLYLSKISKNSSTHRTAHLIPFQTHKGLFECASLLLYSNPAHQLLPRDPQSYPRGLGPTLPRPSLLNTNSRIRFGKGSSFCVQWTAGTFQIRAEFKLSTKTAS